MTILHKNILPTNSEMREMAMQKVGMIPSPGMQGEYWARLLEEFYKLQYYYFPMFCEDTRIANIKQRKFYDDYGNKSKEYYTENGKIGGTSGWSKDGNFKHEWVVSNQLREFMRHIDPRFWDDMNAKVCNSFLRGIMRGDDPYTLLDKVYYYYGSNVEESIKEEALG